MAITDVNQLSTADGRLYEHEDCGLCCSLGEAVDAGLPRDETIASMEAWYAAHGDSPVDGTGLEINAEWLRSEGLPAETFQGGMDTVDAYLAAGYRVTLLIHSNSAGYPDSGAGCVGHFIEVCGRNPDGTYTVMQPVGGMTVSYSRDLLAANSQGAGVVVQHDYRQAGVTTVIGTTSGGTSLMDPTLIFRGFVDLLTYLAYGRNATPAELDWAVARAHAVGAGQAEWYTDEALNGDSIIGPAIHNAVAKLHAVATS